MNQLYQIPNPVTSFGVTCAIGQYVMDTEDPGKEPDLIAIGGAVEITPNLKTPIRIEVDPPRIASHDTMTFSIDPHTGELVHPDGTVGIELVNSNDDLLTPKGWSYTATVRPTKGKTWSVTFTGPPDGVSSVDLALIAPVDPNPGSVIPLDPSFYLTKSEAQDKYSKLDHTHDVGQVLQNGSSLDEILTDLNSSLTQAGSDATNAKSRVESLEPRVEALEEGGGGGEYAPLHHTHSSDEVLVDLNGSDVPLTSIITNLANSMNTVTTLANEANDLALSLEERVEVLTRDTGVRDIRSLELYPDQVNTYSVTLQRVGNTVVFSYMLLPLLDMGTTYGIQFPDGFKRPPGSSVKAIYTTNMSGAPLTSGLLGGPDYFTFYGVDTKNIHIGSDTWLTLDPWPEILPGDPFET